MTSPSATFFADLRKRFPPEVLRLDAAERHAYGYDNSRQHHLPDAVLLARDEADVRTAVKLCNFHGVPLVPRGRGTNTTGASVPSSGGLVLSLERLTQIIAIRPGDRAAVVQPGVLNAELQQALQAHGLFWPPDPTSAPFASIGGNLACNAGGPRTVKYGACRDNVLALTAICGDGNRISVGAAVSKLSSGFDITRALIGSEGTLAVITEATLKLTPLPTARAAMRACYRDIDSAAAAVARIMAQPVTPSMLEFLDGDCVGLVRESGVTLPATCGALLMLEADGEPDALPAAMHALAAAAAGDGLLEWREATDPHAAEGLWQARKALSPSLRRLRPGKINEDVVVPVSKLPSLVRSARAIAAQHQSKLVCFGHAGNGNLHLNVLYDPADAEESLRAHATIAAIFEALPALGGQLSGEHGIGLAKRDYLARAYSEETLGLMRRIKQAFDPNNILNPGKLLP